MTYDDIPGSGLINVMSDPESDIGVHSGDAIVLDQSCLNNGDVEPSFDVLRGGIPSLVLLLLESHSHFLVPIYLLLGSTFANCLAIGVRFAEAEEVVG